VRGVKGKELAKRQVRDPRVRGGEINRVKGRFLKEGSIAKKVIDSLLYERRNREVQEVIRWKKERAIGRS